MGEELENETSLSAGEVTLEIERFLTPPKLDFNGGGPSTLHDKRHTPQTFNNELPPNFRRSIAMRRDMYPP